MIDTNELRRAAHAKTDCDFGSHEYCQIVANTDLHEQAADEIDALRAKVAELEAENAKLKEELAKRPYKKENKENDEYLELISDALCQHGLTTTDFLQAIPPNSPRGRKRKGKK